MTTRRLTPQRIWPIVVATAATALAFASVGAATAEEELTRVPWYVVSLEHDAMGQSTENVFLFSRVEPRESGRLIFWIVERSLQHKGLSFNPPKTSHDWIDGRKCPALASVLADISAIPKMQIVAANREISIRPPADFPRLRISGPEAGEDTIGGARVSRSDYMEGSSKWWFKAEKRLEPCWTKAPVASDAGQFPPWLDKPSDVQFWKSW